MALETRVEQQQRAGEERILALEAKWRDAELNAQVLRRDKTLLLTELEEARAKELKLNDLYKDKITAIESHHHSQLLLLQDSKDRDFLEKGKALQQRVRELEEMQGEAGRGLQAMRAKWLGERQQLLKEVEDTEFRVRQEEVGHPRRTLLGEACACVPPLTHTLSVSPPPLFWVWHVHPRSTNGGRPCGSWNTWPPKRIPCKMKSPLQA
jgi:hypothetical protein